jgi:predicted Rossmann fold nucleotide-binding protein DprA/Smf involved in DNA uptake
MSEETGVEVNEPVELGVEDAASSETDSSARRGRPRSPEVVERDDAVYAVLTAGPATREQVAEAVGITPSAAYLSLWRLKRDEKIKRVEGNGRQWATADYEAPAAEATPEPAADGE